MSNRFGYNFSCPFDPHDAKYFLDRIPKPHSCDVPDGVKIDTIREKDIWFDEEGNERTRMVRYDFYRTRKDYECEIESLMLPSV